MRGGGSGACPAMISGVKLPIFLLGILASACCGPGSQPAPAPIPAGAPVRLDAGDPAVSYRSETRTAPRPLRIHVIEVDLSSGLFELAAAVADDPDGPGPAEARLEEPLGLALRKGFIAAANANPFAGLPDEKGKRDQNWFLGKPVDILGAAVEDGTARSLPQDGYDGVWVDAGGSVRGGSPADLRAAREAAAGFKTAVRDGAVVGKDDVLHPRTAIGWDAGGRRLWLAVVDGRRKGLSEGMTTRELGELMLSLGARDAVNLDGGGSSVLLFAPGGGGLKVMNSPSGGATRPVPVIIGVRKRGNRS